MISGRACNTARENCYIAAHDARTGKEAWRFYTSPGRRRARRRVLGRQRRRRRRAAAWGLPGTYDPVRRLVYWGICQPDAEHARATGTAATPTRSRRHAPADLYSNSTVALNPDTGELVWHYQHLPGDDWDMDINRGEAADPHRHRSRSAAREVDQSERAERRRARRRDHGRRGRRHLGQRPRDGRVPLGDAVPVRHAEFHSRPISTSRPASRTSTQRCCWMSPARPSSSATGTRAASGRRRIRRSRTRCTCPSIDHCSSMTRAVPGGDGERRTSGLPARRRPREVSPASRRSTCARARSAASTKRARPATARCSRRRATSCSGATSAKCCARSTPRRQDPLAIRAARRDDPDEHDHLRCRRQAVCRGDQRRVAARRAATRRDRGRRRAARESRQLDQRVCAAAVDLSADVNRRQAGTLMLGSSTHRSVRG